MTKMHAPDQLHNLTGWKPVLLTWAWAMIIWQIADAFKFLVSYNLQAAEDISAACKEKG